MASTKVKELIERQCNDPKCWIVEGTESEKYLSLQLRALHAAIEGTDILGFPLSDVVSQKID